MTHAYSGDSRADWMGELPEGWQATRLSMVLSQKNAGKSIPVIYRNIGETTLYTSARYSMLTDFSDFPVDLLTGEKDILCSMVAEPHVHLPVNNAVYSDIVHRFSILEGVSRSYVFYALAIASKYIIRHGSVLNVFNFYRWNQLVFPLPPRAVQDIIASYLDREVGVIDQQMDAIQRSIPLLKKRRESLIFEAVTGKYPELFVGDQGEGINPYANDPRGDWMGELPKGWQATRLPFVISASNRGIVLRKVHRAVGSTYFYTCSILPFCIDLDLSEVEYHLDDLTGDRDILLSGMASPYIFLPPVGSAYSQHVHRVRLLLSVDRNYIGYALSASSKFIIRLGVTLDNLNLQRWSQLVFPLPNRETQESIANFLDIECGKIDCTIGAYEKMYGLLKKRRESLIYEAVTGKIPLDLMK